MNKPLCFHLDAFQVEQYRDDFDALEARFTNFWSSLTDPARLITRVRRFSFEPVRQRFQQQTLPLDDVRAVLALFEGEQEGSLSELVRKRAPILTQCVRRLSDAPQVRGAIHAVSAGSGSPAQFALLYDALQRVVWPWRWTKNYRRMYEVLEELAPPLTIDHYLLVFPQSYVDADALRSSLQQTFLLPSATVAPLPPLFRGQYRPTATHLRPLTDGQPYLRVLHAFDTRGVWDFRSFRDLLMDDQELAIAMDIKTLDTEAADKATTNAYGTLNLAVNGRYATKDPRAERALRDVQYAMSALDMQSVHEVAFYILLQAPTVRLLDTQTHALKATFGKRLSLDVLTGAQEDYLRIFTPTPEKQLAAPIIRRNCLSEHLAAKTPWGLRKTNRLAGPLWGHDPHENMPIHYDTFGARGDENGHLVAWSKSGYGKTVFLGAMATRQAVQGHQVICLDPVGKVRRSCKAIGRGAAYYRVKTQSAINILDPVDTEHYRQLGHVMRKLSIILGRVILRGESDVDYIAREFGNLEFGALDQACQHPRVYGEKGHKLATMTAADAPLLEDLVQALRDVATELNGAAMLAEEIVSRALYSFAHIYNARTTLKWDFDHDMVGYNFKGADKLLLPLYYDHAVRYGIR